MEPERHEVYERIPWETLEKRGSDRQWLYVGLAGVVALGALAYSFVENQPAESAPEARAAPATVAVTTPPAPSAPSTVASPLVVTEADLYAVDPERLVDAAVAHAEWFAVEYISVDGSDEAARALGALLPEGVPLPEAPPGTQVFVDWVGAQRITEVGQLVFEVDVLVRSLVSTPESGFVRQPIRMLRVEVHLGENGEPLVTGPPLVIDAPLPSSEGRALLEVPQDIVAQLGGADRVVGGTQGVGGEWRVVVMEQGPDGVIRPVTVNVP